MKQIIIGADENDGDIIYKYSLEKEEDFDMDKLNRIVQAIKNCPKSHNWPRFHGEQLQDSGIQELYEDVLSREDIEYFDNLVPRSSQEDSGIHTIVSVTVNEISHTERLL